MQHPGSCSQGKGCNPVRVEPIFRSLPDEAEAIPAMKTYFKAYATSNVIRHIIESGHLTDLATNPVFSTKDFRAVPAKYRTLIPNYIKDYVSLNQFAA